MNAGRNSSGESPLDCVVSLVERLRSPEGCPWDREQTLDSLKQCLLEEAHELLDAMGGDDPDRHMEELGDVLLQIVMQSQIRREKDEFSFDDVAQKLSEKLIRRHPHVFGDETCKDSAQVLKNWEKIKESEGTNGKRTLFEGVPSTLPALQKAQRVQAKASRVGFDWRESAPVLDKVEEEIAEIRDAAERDRADMLEEEIGDTLFSIVNLCRFYGVNAEACLNGTTQKFIRRFGEVEKGMASRGRKLSECTLEEMDELWEEAKKRLE